MRGWNWGLAAATLLIGAGASKTLADDSCSGDCDGALGADQMGAGNGLASANTAIGFSGVSPLNDGDVADDGFYDADELPAATAYAAPIIATTDSCMGSSSFGAQGMRFGMSVASVWNDDNCRRIKNARQLTALGYRRAAVELLCIDEDVRAAMLSAGTPCPSDERLIPVVAKIEPPTPPPQPESDSVLFDFDSARLKPATVAVLERMLGALRARGLSSVEIEGHADATGADAYNLALSRRRAQAVADWFTAHGVAATLVKIEAKGEAEPIAANATAAGRARNRRVEVLMSPG
jgi:OmpA-OmpF porin, OOP family